MQWLALAATYATARWLMPTRESRQQFLSILLWAGLGLSVVCVVLHFSSPQRVYGLFVSRFYPCLLYTSRMRVTVVERKVRGHWKVVSIAPLSIFDPATK